MLLRELAEDTGLVEAVTDALADTYGGRWVHAPGQVFADLAVTVADGADCVSGIEVLADRERLFGSVASIPTAWRLLQRIDAEHLPRLVAAVGRAREAAWTAGAGPDRVVELLIDIDATITIAHSEKENAAATWKHTFGFHPLLAFLDRPEIASGEALAAILRPGNAGAATAADHVQILALALAALVAASWLVKIRSTRALTRASAAAAIVSSFPSVKRMSNVTSRPSTKPSSLSPALSPSTVGWLAAHAALRTPIRS